LISYNGERGGHPGGEKGYPRKKKEEIIWILIENFPENHTRGGGIRLSSGESTFEILSSGKKEVSRQETRVSEELVVIEGKRNTGEEEKMDY